MVTYSLCSGWLGGGHFQQINKPFDLNVVEWIRSILECSIPNIAVAWAISFFSRLVLLSAFKSFNFGCGNLLLSWFC